MGKTIKHILLIWLSLGASTSFAQGLISPVYTIYSPGLSERLSSHIGLRLGYRESFLASRWRLEFSGVLGLVENLKPELREVTWPLTRVTTRTDYVWYGVNVAFDFSLVKKEALKLQPYLGFGIGIYNYRFEEQTSVVLTETGVLEYSEPAFSNTLGCFVLSGRTGLEYEYSPSLRIILTYAYQRLGDPESLSVLTPLSMIAHELGIGFVYHFGYSKKRA